MVQWLQVSLLMTDGSEVKPTLCLPIANWVTVWSPRFLILG